MTNLNDHVAAELDRRKIEALVEAGTINIEDVARAPIIRAEPSCSCAKGLEMNDKKFGHFPHAALVCPNCKAPSKDIYLCRMCEVYEYGWSDDEAKAEYEENFPTYAKRSEPVDVVCDDCYLQLTAWKSPQEAEAEVSDLANTNPEANTAAAKDTPQNTNSKERQ